MKSWWSGPELAGLPGMPAHRRGVLIWGDAGRIERRERSVGKGWEYHIDSLPPETRAHLAMLAGDPEPAAGQNIPRIIPESSSPAPAAGLPAAPARPAPGPSSSIDTPAPADPSPRLSPEDQRRIRAEAAAKWAALPADCERRRRAEARHWCLRAVGELRRAAPVVGHAADDPQAPVLSLSAACAAWVRDLEAGAVRLPEVHAAYLPRHQGVRGISPDTLLRWSRDYAREGLWGLTDGYGNRAGASRISADETVCRALLGRMLQDPQATGRDLHAWLATVAGIAVPPLRTVQRFRERWIRQNRQLWTLITNPGKWKSHYQVAFGSQHEAVTRLNQVWEMDSTPGDWLLTDGRHTVVGCIDLWSRRLVLRVSKTSSAHAVGQTFRGAVLGWGVPEMVRTDNGQDYVANAFDLLLEDLHVTHELCIPFASEEKGTIERALKSVCYGIAKLLPGYIGHNVAEREAIRARETFAKRVMTPDECVEVSLSSADLQDVLNRWVDHDYHQRPHTGDGMGGLSPVAKAATWREPVRTVEARALDSLLAPLAGERVIGKKGIRWENRRYINAALAAYIGEPVLCRYDEGDIARLFVYRAGAFLCVAIDPDAEGAGISRAEVAAVAKVHQKRAMAEHVAELKRIKKAVATNAADAVLRHRAAEKGTLVPFPARAEPHDTPALAAGAAAAAALEPAPAAVPSAAQVAAMARVRADLAGDGQVTRLPDSPAQRYRRWLQLDRNLRQGLGCDSRDDLDWWERYPQSSEWRAQRRLAADFPEVYGSQSPYERVSETK